MRRVLVLAILASITLALILLHQDKYELENESTKDVTITIVYDNNLYKEGLRTAWGFSCVIRCEKTILFDTGGNGTILLENMKKLNVDPGEIDIVVLSHIHSDHVGGLLKLLEINHNVTVYLPKSFPEGFKEEIERYGARIVEVQEPLKIFDGVYSTGEMVYWVREQSLIIKTERGLIVVTGCAHPGVVNIVKRAKDLLKSNVLLVIGGFHLIGHDESSIRKIVSDLKNLDVKYVAPCHCSGDLARKLFKEEYGDRYINAGVGRMITVKDLR